MNHRMSLEVELTGHLLEDGSLNEILERIHQDGGHAEIRAFRAGASREAASRATIHAADVSEGLLEALETSSAVTRIVVGEPERDASLEVTDIAGAAPVDFYPTTIFPTEVRIAGRWVRAEGQRMDACIVVEDGDPPRARCKLGRDLAIGERVVTGHENGIRLELPPARAGAGGFQFMGAEVSSERRVEVRVEQIAAEMRALRERGGRIAVVAGPVVIHTGGAEALTALVRNGYVQVLLGGNAIAVHDIERSFFGTSLGIDLRSGAVIGGGHSHHIRAINRIRRAGGIREAVAQGLVEDGVMKALVDANVPYVLAGSIRDDGPLPDTVMDLIEAQRQYMEHLQGVEMILMLATMLHAIGVGNMTPSGVKMICVDISPAVATKLADRGSLESVGIVTDVGLFLRLLAEKLEI